MIVRKLLGRALVLVVSASWLACGVDGERAMMMGACPEGEVCSPETPEGLRFIGAGTFDAPFSSWTPTAVGGTQRIDVQLGGWSGGDLPPFQAESDDPGVFEVDAAGGSVDVRATGPGSALLRITDDAGALLDRMTLSTAEVDRVELKASRLLGASPEAPWAFRRGGSGSVIFALRSAGGGRLIDESAQPVAGPGVEPIAWDAARVTFEGEGDELTLAIDLGAGRRQASAPLVDAIDRIDAVRIDSDVSDDILTVTAGESAYLCFIAFLGEHAVAGVRFEVTSEGPIELGSTGADEPVSQLCVGVEGLEAGQAAVIVRAEGEELRQVVRVEG